MRDRSPIPLADALGGGVAAVSGGIERARTAAGSRAGGLLRAIQDLLPRRGVPHRRAVPAATRREAQRRAAGAVLVLVAVASILGVALFLVGGAGEAPIDEIAAGQRALAAARADLGRVFADGGDLIQDAPQEAERLLLSAFQQLDVAAANDVPAGTLRPLREQAAAALDEIYGVVEIAPRVAFSFAGQEPRFDLAALVRGPDGAPYVLDGTTRIVYRVDLEGGTATAVISPGTRVGALEVAELRHLAAGGRDVLALDANNVLWRWRPADETGKGTLARIRVAESAAWGEDVLGIGTFLRNVETGLYNLYVIDPSEQQLLRYSPALDGSGFPASATGYFTVPRDVSGVTSLVIDGDVFVADAGVVTRYARGRSLDWSLAVPPDGILRPPPRHQLLASPQGRSEGLLYSFDPVSRRVIAFDKASGRYVAQYRIAAAGGEWRDLRAFYVVDRVRGEPPLIFWIDGETLGVAELRDAADAAPATPEPPGEPGATPAPSP
jgi:outer membrane murein-binding lipoprotein Lpp